MPSIPLTAEEERRVLATLGLQSIDDLFSSIPPKIREGATFKLDPGPGYSAKNGLSEHELRVYFSRLGEKNAPRFIHFLGGGVYDNIIPAIVNQLVLRGEFLTCYTPYQPEVSQGTLAAIFEFQTLITRLTAMEVSNASLYDGATATAEAVLMAQRLAPNERKRCLIAAATHPDTKQVIKTFLRCHSPAPLEIGWNAEGNLDLSQLSEMAKRENPYTLVVSCPNYFGIIEKLDKIRDCLPENCLLIVSVADPSYLSLFEPPGLFGADIVVGEAHQFGTPMSFGGPHVGFFATKKSYLRQMTGRLVGETRDSRGRIAYALALSTREQHIRREKATSNICTNQGLIALRTTIYLSFLGKEGFVRLGEMNYSLFDYLSSQLSANGIPLRFKGMHYREGVFEIPNLGRRFLKATQTRILPGIRLCPLFTRDPDFSDSLLISVHPKHTKEDLDRLVEVLSHD